MMELKEKQRLVANDTHRFRVCISGRRWGKTMLAIREICYFAKEPNREIYYVSPSYRMSKTIVWRKLKNILNDLRWVRKINESEMSIVLKNNSTIALKGADNYDSLRGVGLDFLVMDEFADIAPEAFYEVLRPALSDREGHALFLGTPKGLNWAYDIFNMPNTDADNWASYQFTTIDGGWVPEEEIEQARRDLDPKTFDQEYRASFVNHTGRIYYSFDRQHNVVELPDPNTRIISIGLDFNISPLCAVISVIENDDIYVIDEIKMDSSNTDEVVDEIKLRYPNSKIFVYPDPAGHQRKTSAGGMTDITILQNAGFVVKVRRSHTPVRDRINSVNSRLCSTDGERHLFVSPKCRFTIECLERQTYKEGSSQPDKSAGYDHMNDALGYLVDYLYPLKRQQEIKEQPWNWGHSLAAN